MYKLCSLRRWLASHRHPSQLETFLIAETLASLRRISAIARTAPANNLEEMNMALVDIINAATAQINTNTAAIAAGGDTTVLQAQITELQGELDAANSAAGELTTAVEAQTEALAPKAPEQPAESA